MRGLLIGVIVVTLSWLSLQADILEAVLVKVNGDIITKTELEERQIAHLRQLQRQGDVSIETDADVEQVLAKEIPRLIVEAINELLLVQRGREMGFAMEEDDFAEIVENIKKDNELESDEQFQAALAQEDMTLDDLRRALERQFIISRVQQIDILSKVGMTDTEAREYYDSHPEEYRSPARVTLREILITAPGGGTDEPLSAAGEVRLKARVDAVLGRVQAGEAFASLAAEVSDAPSRANGGLIGPLDDEDLAPAVRDVLAEMEVGDISEPLPTPMGYQLLQLESATEATRLPFEDVRADISNRVFNERRAVEYTSYMRRLRDEAIIEWKSEDLKAAYDEYIGTAESAVSGS